MHTLAMHSITLHIILLLLLLSTHHVLAIHSCTMQLLSSQCLVGQLLMFADDAVCVHRWGNLCMWTQWDFTCTFNDVRIGTEVVYSSSFTTSELLNVLCEFICPANQSSMITVGSHPTMM